MSSKFLNANTDVNLSANSDSQIPSQKAVKTYVDNKTSVLATKEEVTTITNQIGDQVSVIESKIPSEASDTNQLADKQFVQDLTSALNFVTWVDTLPETGESKYIYAVPREETDTDGKQIAALYLWDGSAWRGAGAFSLNIDPDTLAKKTDLTNYLPLTGGKVSGKLIVSPTFELRRTDGELGFSMAASDINYVSGKSIALASNMNIVRYTGTSYANPVLWSTDKAVANGVASLDANAKVPSEQIPDLSSTYATINSLATVATSGSYNDLTNKPTIPTVNNGTLTVQKNGTNVATFTANQSTASTANIEVPTKLSELTDDLGSSPVHTHSQYSTVANTVTNVVAGSTADKINVTKNGSTSTITINNVANATNATKATKDADGNTISTTYAKKSTLAIVATSGMYSDLTGTPGAATTDTFGLVKVDGTTITATADGVISAVGGSGFDFEGTKAEFDAAVAAGTITEDSVSLITDDVSGDTVATKAELQAVDRSKADTALSNVLANIDYVVESKFPTADDPSWYRVYKSGWVEQGGFSHVTSGTVTVSLSKPFLNTAFSALAMIYGNPTIDIGYIRSSEKTTSTIKFNTLAANSNDTFQWEAKGMGAK